MMRQILINAALALCTLAAQAPQLPDTPAGKAFGAWLKAMNSPEAMSVEVYAKVHEPQGDADHVKMLQGIRERTGGFDLV